MSGWSFDVEALYIALRRGYRVVAIPIDWYADADSKVNPVHDTIRMVRDLLKLYRAQPALWEVDFEWTGFEWIDFHDWEQSVISFKRKARNPADSLIVAGNFTPVLRQNYSVGVDEPGSLLSV